jgi:hypothetical protein
MEARMSETDAELDRKIEEGVAKALTPEKVAVMVNPIITHLRDSLYPSGQAPLKAGPVVGLQMSQPPIISQPRPMMPPPPALLPAAHARGIPHSPTLPLRPKTQYALELEKAAEMKAPTRMCAECGGVKMVKIKRNKKREIIEYHACPKCVDCEVVEG